MSERRELQKVSFSVADLRKAGWPDTLWLRYYAILNIPPAELQRSGPVRLDLGEIQGLAFFGEFKHLRAEFKLTRTGIPADYIVETKDVPEPAWSYLLLGTTFVDGDPRNDESACRRRLDACAGLLAAFNGRNIVGDLVHEEVRNLTSGQSNVFTIAMESVGWHGIPHLTKGKVEGYEEAYRRLTALPEVDQRRIALALRWFREGLFDGRGVDSFLKIWIGIEALAMEDGTNIAPLKQRLGAIYDLSTGDVESHLFVGRIWGLRGKIVHGGKVTSLDGRFVRYVTFLFVDLLIHELELPPGRVAAQFSVQDDFRVDSYLAQVLRDG